MSYYVNPHEFSCPWYPYAQQFGAPNIKWCEETLCTWVSEPANTWSNFAYIIVAIAIGVYSHRKENDSDLDMFPRLFLVTAFLSGLYHASNNYLTQLLDFAAMYGLIFWAMTLNLKKVGKINDGNKYYFFGGMTTLGLVVTHFLYLSQLPIQILILIATFLFLFTEFQARKFQNFHYKYFFSGLGFIGVGEIFSVLDASRSLCNPLDHVFQGHALWHVLSAIGLGLIYLHFAQTQPLKNQSEQTDYIPSSELDMMTEEQVKLSPEGPREEEEITKEHDITEFAASDSEDIDKKDE